MGMTTSGKNAEDVLDMCAILFGEEILETHPVVTGNCNSNSPLVWDETILSAMRAFNRLNQPVLCSPFILGGANTPASTAAAVAQLNAEALSALAYTQVVRKGCPAIYGHYLGHEHTLATFKEAFFMPRLFDNNSYEQWAADGSISITERALTEAKHLLDSYVEPKLDEGVNEELQDYIARREREIPVVDALNTDH